MKYIFVMLVVFFQTPAVVFAQTDSTKIQYTEENAASSDFNLKEKYNYLIRAQVEEKSLLKIGVYGFGLSGTGDGVRDGYLTYGLGYEQKLKPSFSVLADFRHTLEFNKPIMPEKYSLNVGARYYYNIETRIRKGKSANNFSANYLGILQQNILQKGNENYLYYTNVNFLYGLQRRIGKYGYVDFGFGPMVQLSDQKNRLSLNILFSIGLGF